MTQAYRYLVGDLQAEEPLLPYLGLSQDQAFFISYAQVTRGARRGWRTFCVDYFSKSTNSPCLSAAGNWSINHIFGIFQCFVLRTLVMSIRWLRVCKDNLINDSGWEWIIRNKVVNIYWEKQLSLQKKVLLWLLCRWDRSCNNKLFYTLTPRCEVSSYIMSWCLYSRGAPVTGRRDWRLPSGGMSTVPTCTGNSHHLHGT